MEFVRFETYLPACVSFWNNKFSDIEWEDFWLLQQYFLFLIKLSKSPLKLFIIAASQFSGYQHTREKRWLQSKRFTEIQVST